MTKYRVLLISQILFIGTSLAIPADAEEKVATAEASTAPSVASSDVSSAAPPASSSNVPTSSVLPEGISASTIAEAAEILARAKDDILLGNGTIPDDGDGIPDEGWEYENTTYVDTRRILYSKTVEKGKRPYMVYLQLTRESAKAHKYRGWLCGGVIVDRYYVLTSAACVEDADRFYIVSGTTKFIDSFDYKNNECVCKHRRKVVWKCIPKNYKFDFQDSIKWSSNDIAIVKVDRPFKFGVLEKGCEFATDLICINNVSRELEKPGTKGFIAGWGSGSNFREGVYRRQNGKVHIPQNAKCLQEAKVCVMDNEQCAKRWAQRFRNIITQYMICTKDVMKRLSELCEKKYANCTDVDSGKGRRDMEQYEEPTNEVSTIWNIDLGRHLRDPDDYTARRASNHGGFCENDHGGPLIVKYQNKERVIGVISACKIDPKSHNCHGPFLYTSVFRNRQFISCAINKDVQENCRRVFRTGITHEEWQVSWDGYKEDDEVTLKADRKRNKHEFNSEEVFKDKNPLKQSVEEDVKKVSVKAVDEDDSSSEEEDEDEEEEKKEDVKKPVNIKEVKKEQEMKEKTTIIKEATEENDGEEIKKLIKTIEAIKEDEEVTNKPIKIKEANKGDGEEIAKPVNHIEAKKEEIKVKVSVKTKVQNEGVDEDDGGETEENTPKIEKKQVKRIRKRKIKNYKTPLIKQKKVEKNKDTKVEEETDDEDESEEIETTTVARVPIKEAVAEVIEPKKIPAEYIDQGDGDNGRDSDKAEVFYESSRDDNVNDPMEE